MDSRGPRASRPARAVAFTSAVALAYGTVVHIAALALGGTDPYPAMPRWLSVYFISLTVLDPLAAVLLFRRRRAGLVLGCAVLLTDAAANGYANYVLDETAGFTAGRFGQALISALALALTVAALQLWTAHARWQFGHQ